MKTSVIRYRVADFLREHPPFDLFSVTDLLAFSGTGRVTFHEDDVYLVRKDEPREQILWIIQQGRVEIIDETSLGDQLRDVLGPGDIVVPARTSDATVNSFSIRTSTEVILYSFDSVTFEALVQKNSGAQRFLAAHLSATSRQTRSLQSSINRETQLTEREKASWLNASSLPSTLPRLRLTTCSPHTPLPEVATLIADARSEDVVVTAADSHPLGLITSRDFCEIVRSGVATTDLTAERVMHRGFHTALPGLRAADYLLAMLKTRAQSLVITRDGTPNAPVEGVIIEDDLTINCGRNPALIIRELLAAETVEELAYLRGCSQAFIAEELAGPTVVEWFWQMNGVINAIVVERAVQIAIAEMERAGRYRGAQFCLLFFGAAGRQESLTANMPAIGMVYEDTPESIEESQRYFSTLAKKVATKLEACTPGLQSGSNPALAAESTSCRPLSEWKKFYAGLIRDPILNSIYSARQFFDFSVACGETSLAAELRSFIVTELDGSELFIPVLANDTLSSLPPLTFFDGSVIEVDGVQRQTLDLEKTALSPIVDAARVFALSRTDITVSGTISRLENAAHVQSHVASIFKEAAGGLRIAAWQHALAQFKEQKNVANAAIVHSSRLSRFEQRLLKTVFDSVRRLLELVTESCNQGSRTLR